MKFTRSYSITLTLTLTLDAYNGDPVNFIYWTTLFKGWVCNVWYRLGIPLQHCGSGNRSQWQRTLFMLLYSTVRQSIGAWAQSTLRGGARHFCPKNMYEQLTEFPNFTWFCSKRARILHNNCPNNIFPIFFFWGGEGREWGETCPLTPLPLLRL